MSKATPIAQKLTAAAVLFAACVAGLVTAPPALAKTAPKPVLDGSAVAVPDQYSADTAQQIFAEGGNASRLL
jgi:gamma-glutamyltranspeptidase/glutathione hydrolase